MRYSGVIIILMVVSTFGCSNSNVVDPETTVMNRMESISPHSPWGLWQFSAYPDAGILDVVPLRMGEMHLNALPFLNNSCRTGTGSKMENLEAVEKELLEVVDDVIRQFEPVLKADDIFIDKSPIIKPRASGHGYTSAVVISFCKWIEIEDRDARSIGHIFDVLLFLKGKAEDADEIRRAMVSEFEWFMENLKDGNIHWL